MAALSKSIGDSVASEINASGLLPAGVSAAHVYVPTIDLEVKATLQCQVIAPLLNRTRADRNNFRNDFLVQVGLSQLLASDDPADVDPVVEIVENVLNIRYANVAAGGRQAAFNAATVEPLYDIERLERMNEFVSILTLTFVEFQGA